MKNIKLLHLDKYNDLSKYELAESGIYKFLNDNDDTCYRMSLSMEIEDEENIQYPLEDILDKYFLYVSDFIDNTPPILNIEFAGELDDINNLKQIIGKRVFNHQYTDNGNTYTKLIIE